MKKFLLLLFNFAYGIGSVMVIGRMLYGKTKNRRAFGKKGGIMNIFLAGLCALAAVALLVAAATVGTGMLVLTQMQTAAAFVAAAVLLAKVANRL
ncbi:MAG: hypothetical protein HGB03_02105 [Candidatus Yonathbacteria bacterium]|nr:hypothetical protein [Candidatus Yonathbacteria bacterium]NTW48048.1 hypothetical protein [Candidatus Yonathbacteria bacterium]